MRSYFYEWHVHMYVFNIHQFTAVCSKIDKRHFISLRSHLLINFVSMKRKKFRKFEPSIYRMFHLINCLLLLPMVCCRKVVNFIAINLLNEFSCLFVFLLSFYRWWKCGKKEGQKCAYEMWNWVLFIDFDSRVSGGGKEFKLWLIAFAIKFKKIQDFLMLTYKILIQWFRFKKNH